MKNDFNIEKSFCSLFVIIAIVFTIIFTSCKSNAVSPTINILFSKDSMNLYTPNDSLSSVSSHLDNCTFKKLRITYNVSTNDTGNNAYFNTQININSNNVYYVDQYGMRMNSNIDSTLDLSQYSNYAMDFHLNIGYVNHNLPGLYIKVNNIKLYQE